MSKVEFEGPFVASGGNTHNASPPQPANRMVGYCEQTKEPRKMSKVEFEGPFVASGQINTFYCRHIG